MPAKPFYDELEQPVRDLEHSENDRQRATNISGENTAEALPHRDKELSVAQRLASNYTVLDITEREQLDVTLQENESRYVALFDASSDAILFIESDTGQILEANSRAATIFGYSREELLGKKNWELSAEPEETRRITQGARTTPGKVFTVPLSYLRRKDGNIFPAELTGRSFSWQERSVFIVTFRDITERKKSEDALRESEEKYRALIDQAAEGIVLVDTETLRFMDFNDVACAGLGYSREEFAGLTLCDVQGSLTRDEFINRFRAIVESGGGKFENRQRRKDGTFRDTIISNQVITLQGRKYITGIWQDVTERKQAEEALRESEDRYRSLVEDQIELVSRIRSDGTLLYANKGYRNFFNIPQLLEESDWHPVVFPDDLPMIKERLASLSTDNPVVLIENRVYNAAGEIRWLQFSNQGFFDADGALQEIQSVGRDITERMEAEAARQRHSSLLAAINRVLEMGLGRETEEQTCELFLELAEMVTSSRISFIGEIGTDGFLHDLAISNPAWDACSMRDKSGHRRLPGNLPIRGVLGRVLIDGRSLIVNDPASHPDWIGMPPGHPPLTNFMGVPLTREGSTVGLVAVGNREGDYSTEDLHALEAMARAIVEALGRKRAEEALRNSLNEKEVLLREVHHRVKNNMAAIVGLLNLQCRAINDPQFQAVITELTSRIRAMSIVHEKLYLSESLARVDFQEYLESLIFHLRTTFGSPRITCEVSAQGVNMPLDLAVPCGMIVNELITNALKYAFPQNSGKEGEDNCILVAMSQDNNICTLTVADNGIGLPAGFDLKQNTTLGLCLVDMLGSHQLGGRYDINNRGGTRFTLTFSLAR